MKIFYDLVIPKKNFIFVSQIESLEKETNFSQEKPTTYENKTIRKKNYYLINKIKTNKY